MTVKERLHSLIDRLPDDEAERIEEELRRLCEESDPVWKVFRDAPNDDEPLHYEQIQAIETSLREIARGETVSWEEIALRIPDGDCEWGNGGSFFSWRMTQEPSRFFISIPEKTLVVIRNDGRCFSTHQTQLGGFICQN
jgi:hypothetical protein